MGEGGALASRRVRRGGAVGAARARGGCLVVVLLTLVSLLAASPAEAQATPVLATQASPSGFPVGTPIFDVATLGMGDNPTGTITFDLYGPDNPTCSGAPITSSEVSVAGNGNYQSQSFTPSQAGTYQWVARYSGDANNLPVATVCGDPAEQVVLGKRTPTLSTQASAVPGGTFDTAVLGNGAGPAGPTGTLTFDLYGPDNLTCAGPPIFSDSVGVTGNGSYQSDTFFVTVPGTYTWVVRYSGDENNFGATTICADPAESVAVTPGPATPTLATQASPDVPVGGQLTDTAFLSGGVSPTGTITFQLFGPDDASCTGPPVFAPTVPVAGAGTYTSPPFTPTAPGTYRWVASYSGDADDNPVTTTCGDPAETVIVTGPTAAAITVAKDATPASRPEPGGDFTFSVTVTNTGGQPVTLTGATDSIYGDLATRPGSTCGGLVGVTLDPTETASCQFTGAFTGGAGQSQTDVVTVAGVAGGIPLSATDDATVSITPLAPSVAVVKTVTPPDLPEPGGTFTFGVAITNTSGEPVTVTSIVDNLYGNLATRAGSTCGVLVGTSLAPGQSANCSFTATFTGAAGATQTDTVTVTVQDDENTTATATDQATVAITSVSTPQVVVNKSVTPSSRPEPGGDFTYSVSVSNTSTQTVQLTSLTDDVYGDLNGRGTCSAGATLAAGDSYSCSFTATFTGNAGATQTNTVTATVTGDGGATATASDQATVAITDAPPSIAVTKVANPALLPEQGGPSTYTVTVTNVGVEPLRITSLVDDVHGNLATRPGSTCASATGTLLAPGASYTCTFTATFTGEAGARRTNTVRATVVDNEGTVATGTGSATVTLFDVPPKVEVDLAVRPASRPEPGGTFTYTVTVRNTSNPEAVTVTSLTSSRHGDLNGRGTCRVGVALAPPPAPGSVYVCSFQSVFTGSAGDRQVTRVTVRVVDNERTSATATSAEVAVTLTAPPPPVTIDKAAFLPSVAEPPPVKPSLALTGTGVAAPAQLALLLTVAGALGLAGVPARRQRGRRLDRSNGPGGDGAHARRLLLGYPGRRPTQRNVGDPSGGLGLGG